MLSMKDQKTKNNMSKLIKENSSMKNELEYIKSQSKSPPKDNPISKSPEKINSIPFLPRKISGYINKDKLNNNNIQPLSHIDHRVTSNVTPIISHNLQKEIIFESLSSPRAINTTTIEDDIKEMNNKETELISNDTFYKNYIKFKNRIDLLNKHHISTLDNNEAIKYNNSLLIEKADTIIK